MELEIITGSSQVRASSQKKKINVDDLAEGVKDFISKIDTIMKNIPESVNSYKLSEFEVSAEVSGKGTLSLLGSGGEVGAKGGIKFVFKK